MEQKVAIERANDGSHSVWVPDLPDCASSGDSTGDALRSIKEAIKVRVETLRSFGEPVPPTWSIAGIVNAA